MRADQAASMIRQLPEYKEKMQKYNSHVELCTKCFTLSKEWDLNKLGTLEQDIACGVDKEGEDVLTPQRFGNSVVASSRPLTSHLQSAPCSGLVT